MSIEVIWLFFKSKGSSKLGCSKERKPGHSDKVSELWAGPNLTCSACVIKKLNYSKDKQSPFFPPSSLYNGGVALLNYQLIDFGLLNKANF